MSDPVKAHSVFLSSYMSNHTDTLVCYVKHYGKIADNVTTAKMTGIDHNQMLLSYQTTETGNTWTPIAIVFEPPLTAYDEVKPRLMHMKHTAETALGMSKSTKLSTFGLTLGTFKALPVLLTLLLLSTAPYDSSYIPPKLSLPHPIPPIPLALPQVVATPLSTVRQVLPFTPRTSKVVWLSIAFIHIALALYVAYFSFKTSTGFRLGSLWVLSTLLLSYPCLFEFRSHVQTSRIKSIPKNH